MPKEIILLIALAVLSAFGALIGFPFWISLGFSLALALVFYMIQSSSSTKDSR